VKHPNDDALTQLERDWPHWQVWTVYQAVGGTVWCARRRDDHKKVINADSAAHLAEALENEVSEPIDHGWVSGTSGTEIGGTPCTRCGQPKPDDGNLMHPECEHAEGAEALAALRGTEPIPLMDQPMTGALLREMYPAWTIERNPLGVWTAERTHGTAVRFLAATEAWELGLKIKAAEAAGS
jgi:hypothetical protein